MFVCVCVCVYIYVCMYVYVICMCLVNRALCLLEFFLCELRGNYLMCFALCSSFVRMEEQHVPTTKGVGGLLEQKFVFYYY
jgi:hypothetical protein